MGTCSCRLFLMSLMAVLLVAIAPAGLRAKPRELSLSPAAAPSPALHYRLLPISSELNPR